MMSNLLSFDIPDKHMFSLKHGLLVLVFLKAGYAVIFHLLRAQQSPLPFQ